MSKWSEILHNIQSIFWLKYISKNFSRGQNKENIFLISGTERVKHAFQN
jgi:hypothetical protein